jgi:hypothetical protein
MRKYINIKWVSLLILVLVLPLSAQTWTIQTIDGSIYKKVDLISIDGEALVYKDKKGTRKTQISDITQLQSIKDEKLSSLKVGLGLCGIGVGGIIGFLGLMSSTNNDINYNPAIGVPLIMVGSLAIYKSFTWAFYSKDKQTYDFNKIPAEKKKEILIRLIEHGELWSKSST